MTTTDVAAIDDPTAGSATEQTDTLTPSEDRAREVLYGRDWYVEEYEAVAGDSVSHELLMRRHFGTWADLITSAALGPNPGETQWGRFREFMGDPERYPGGREGLLGDALHAEAVRRLGPRIREAVIKARQELAELERDERSLDRREVCPFCQRKRDGISEHRTGRVGLDTRNLCDTCVETAQRDHAEWVKIPAPVRDTW